MLWSESMRKSRDTHDVWLLPSKVTIGRRVKKGHPGRAGHPDVLSTSIRRQTVRLKLRSRRNLSLVGLGYLVLAVAYCGYFSDSDFGCRFPLLTIRATIVDIIDLRLSTFTAHVILLCCLGIGMIICEFLHANDTARMTARKSLCLVRIEDCLSLKKS